jgi:hypothetical protein
VIRHRFLIALSLWFAGIGLPGFVTAQTEYTVSCPKGAIVRRLEGEEAELRTLANMYRNSGMGDEYQFYRSKLLSIHQQFPKARVEDALITFRITRDPRCALGALHQVTGVKLIARASASGGWDLLLDGRVIHQQLTDEEFVTLVKRVL